MKDNSFGGYSTINKYVKAKLNTMDSMELSFSSLFSIMFSERDNIMYERSFGYRIEKTSYGESHDRILKRASRLKEILPSAHPQSIVGLYMQNSLQWIELFWAILCCGYCPLLMNTRLDEGTLEESLSSVSAVAVISDGHEFSCLTIAADDIMSDNAYCPAEFGEKIIVMSSGTSSKIKLCFYTADEFSHLIRDSYGIIKKCSAVKKHYEGQLKLLTFLPFYHVFGLIAVYIWFAFFARTFVHLPDLSPQTILGTIRRHKVTHIFAVPLFWEKVYDEAIRTIKGRGNDIWLRFQKGMKIASALGDIPMLGKLFSRLAFKEVRDNLFGNSISFMITGGSEINIQVLKFFNSIGYPLVNGYGMTEIGITSVELSSRYSLRTAGYVGEPLSSVEYSINENGELLVRGKSLARHIIEGDRSHVRDGSWFHTGDIAECTKGHYRILGRRDDLIISSSGENINPNLVEPKLILPEVKSLCLVKNEHSEAILLISVPRHVSSEKLAETINALRKQIFALGLNGQIKKIFPIEGELMNENEFKLNRSRLSRDYCAGLLKEATGEQPATNNLHDALYKHIAELFAVALETSPDNITPNTDFFLDGGGSSLDYFVFLEKLREDFNIDNPTVDGVSLTTPVQIYEYIRDGE